MRGPNARQGGGFGAGQGGGGAGAAGAGQPGAAKPDGAAAQPGNGQSANGQPGAGKFATGQNQTPRITQTFQRLQDSLASLNLSGDQKTQVQAIIDDGKKQFADLHDKVQAGSMTMDDLRNQAPQVFAAMRDQLAGVLTTDQQEKLRDAIQSRFDKDNGTSAATATPAPTFAPPPTTKPVMKTDSMDQDSKPQKTDGAGSRGEGAGHDRAGCGPEGGGASAELNLQGLNGRNVQLSSFKGKPLVIEFGSYTSPSFRQRAAKMEELSKQYGLRANFLIVYTKEAHAVGEWEIDRNRDDGVRVAKHTDIAARQVAARDARQALRLSIPITLDTMDDAVTTAFGASENSAIVIGRDGKIAGKADVVRSVRASRGAG